MFEHHQMIRQEHTLALEQFPHHLSSLFLPVADHGHVVGFCSRGSLFLPDGPDPDPTDLPTPLEGLGFGALVLTGDQLLPVEVLRAQTH